MDEIDQAQQRQLDEVEHILAARPVPVPGRTACANLDCAEPIAPHRQALGAQLCLDCQQAAEREASQCRRGM